MTISSQEVTQLLIAWGQGDESAREQLMPLIYGELHRMAGRYLAHEVPGHTLQTTALIHEAYLRLAGQSEPHWENRAHFFGVAAQVMRHILVDYARARHRAKRGGGWQVVPLEDATAVSAERAAEVVALDQALEALAAFDQRKSRVVELRYFGGLSLEETAAVLKISIDSVKRDWRLAKAWLLNELSRQ